MVASGLNVTGEGESVSVISPDSSITAGGQGDCLLPQSLSRSHLDEVDKKSSGLDSQSIGAKTLTGKTIIHCMAADQFSSARAAVMFGRSAVKAALSFMMPNGKYCQSKSFFSSFLLLSVSISMLTAFFPYRPRWTSHGRCMLRCCW